MPNPTVPIDVEGAEKAPLTKEEKKQVWKYRLRILGGLTLPFFLDSIDVTIIATALPHIAADFDQLTQQSWIAAAFSLTNTAFIPAFGQLCDVFGRHTVLQLALVLMWVGSALCAGAQTFYMLLIGRAITGISSAGLYVVNTVILGDKVSLKENALQNTLFSMIAGASFGIGPVIGGYLTSIHWRYCFGLSIPLSLIAHVLVYFLLRPVLVKAQTQHELSRTDSGNTVIHHRKLSLIEKLAVVDWEGMTIFVLGCVSLILALTWGGSTYEWSSPQIIVLLVVGMLLLVLFLFVEKGMNDNGWLKTWAAKRGDGTWLQSRRAMVPLQLFDSKDVSSLAFINFSSGCSLYAMFYFIAVYFTLVEAYPPEKAGVQLLIYIPGLGAGAYSAMYLCNVYPAETFPAILIGSGLVLPIATGLLTRALDVRHEGWVLGMMALCGFGNGLIWMPLSLHAIGRKPKQLAKVVATMQFFEPMGGTVALALMGSVLNNKVGGAGVGELVNMEPAKGTEVGEEDSGVAQGSILEGLDPATREVVQEAVKEGVKWAFIAILPILVLAAVVTMGLGNVVIDRKKLDDRVEEQEKTEGEREQQEEGAGDSVWVRERLALLQWAEKIRENGVWWAVKRVLKVFRL
ncbi:major facilitator superfamily domain-containing protein [Kalaharituber pfeilii]|nr:major facilitator superfamily domain-containing protein [Kalaharituber pfeilii]